MARFLETHMPAFSSLASNVQTRRGSDGRTVTSYDITPGLGPKFAYKVAGSADFVLPSGQKFSLVELDIGPDEKAGAKSAYTGKAYHLYGEGWAAELWDNCKVTDADGGNNRLKMGFADASATLGHNLIVDGVILGRNGFRHLALEAEKAVEPPPTAGPRPTVTARLIDFANSKQIPATVRAEIQQCLADERARRSDVALGSDASLFPGGASVAPVVVKPGATSRVNVTADLRLRESLRADLNTAKSRLSEARSAAPEAIAGTYCDAANGFRDLGLQKEATAAYAQSLEALKANPASNDVGSVLYGALTDALDRSDSGAAAQLVGRLKEHLAGGEDTWLQPVVHNAEGRVRQHEHLLALASEHYQDALDSARRLNVSARLAGQPPTATDYDFSTHAQIAVLRLQEGDVKGAQSALEAARSRAREAIDSKLGSAWLAPHCLLLCDVLAPSSTPAKGLRLVETAIARLDVRDRKPGLLQDMLRQLALLPETPDLRERIALVQREADRLSGIIKSAADSVSPRTGD